MSTLTVALSQRSNGRKNTHTRTTNQKSAKDMGGGGAKRRHQARLKDDRLESKGASRTFERQLQTENCLLLAAAETLRYGGIAAAPPGDPHGALTSPPPDGVDPR